MSKGAAAIGRGFTIRLWAALSLMFAALFLVSPSLVFAQTSASPYTTGYRFDAMRRLVGMISADPDASGALTFPATRYTFDADGQLIKTEKGVLAAWQAEAIAPSAWSGFTVQSTALVIYDAVGNKVDERTLGDTLTTQSVTQTSYDANDRPLCTAQRLNLASIPAAGSDACALGTAGTEGPDRITKTVYDAAGQVLQVRKAVGTPLEQAYATYAYTGNGKQSDVVDANGNRAQLIYDGFDRLSQWNFPSKTAPTAYNPATQATAFPTANAVNTADYEGYLYDANGNRTFLRKRDGSAITYQYDALNRNTVKIVPERAGLAATHTRDVYYGYDLRGLQTSARFDSAVGDGVASSYDALGRLKSSTIIMDGNVRTLSYDHDANGNRTRLTYPDGQSFGYGYDGLDRMKGIDAGPTFGTGALISQAYDNYGRRGSLGFGAAAPAPACPSATAPAAQLTRYCYDPISRLQSLGHGFTTTANNLMLGFGYNPASQIISETRDNDAYVHRGDYNVTRAYVANGLNQYVSAGPASFTYDPNGNLTSDGAVTYAYDIENRIIGASGAKTANLRYDPLGRLYEVNAGSASSATRFLYDGDALVAEYDGTSAALSRRYVHGSGVDEPLIWYEGADLSNKRSLRANHQGSIIAVADGAGQQIGALTYDPYGIPGAANFGRFQYTGQIWLKELGVYHYKARAYSPTLGRFLQTDPIGYEDQVNLYAYVGNDPVNARDPTGLFCETICPAALEVATTAVEGTAAATAAVAVGVTLGIAVVVNTVIGIGSVNENENTTIGIIKNPETSSSRGARRAPGERKQAGTPNKSDDPNKKVNPNDGTRKDNQSGRTVRPTPQRPEPPKEPERAPRTRREKKRLERQGE